MKIQTYSIVSGTIACDGCCPYCVSKMTPAQGIGSVPLEIHWRNFDKACRFAKDSVVSTVLITGKGEPTLFPGQISDYLEKLRGYNFPFIELQTNGMRLFQKKEEYRSHLERWYELGLNTIAISIAHYDNRQNQRIYQPKGPYMDLSGLINYLHSLDFSIRLSCVIFKGGIDNVKDLESLIDFAQDYHVEQLSIRPVAAPSGSEDPGVAKWVIEHRLDEKIHISPIRNFLSEKGREVMRLVHGAVIYDVGGQNICLTNALTSSASDEEVRQLIFFPDGHLRYDWQYPGAILL